MILCVRDLRLRGCTVSDRHAVQTKLIWEI